MQNSRPDKRPYVYMCAQHCIIKMYSTCEGLVVVVVRREDQNYCGVNTLSCGLERNSIKSVCIYIVRTPTEFSLFEVLAITLKH